MTIDSSLYLTIAFVIFIIICILIFFCAMYKYNKGAKNNSNRVINEDYSVNVIKITNCDLTGLPSYENEIAKTNARYSNLKLPSYNEIFLAKT